MTWCRGRGLWSTRSWRPSAYCGVATTRSVEPHRLVHTGRRWYLVAWDRHREDWRTFRADRIKPDLTTGDRFKPRQPPAQDIAAYVSRAVSLNPYPYRARVILNAAAAEVAEKIPPTVGVLEAIDEGKCLLQTGAQSLDILAVWMAIIGVDFEIQEPLELVDRIREVAARFNRATAS